LQVHDYYRLGLKKEIIDLQCRVAGTIFLQAEALGFNYGLFSNAVWSGPGELKVEPNCSFDHLDYLFLMNPKSPDILSRI
jgi:hypothetical protein